MRNRGVHFFCAVLAAAVGIISRWGRMDFLPDWFVAYAGDTMWALALFLVLGVLLPRISTFRLAMLTLAISVAVELSQFYHADWIDTLRARRAGGWILGYGFKWSDLACYAVGCGIGAACEAMLRRERV